MFIRFCKGEIHEESHVAAGLFCAAYDLQLERTLPAHERDAIYELDRWFTGHMKSPFDYLQETEHYKTAVCWFKPTAREHLARAWELVGILERNDVMIWTIKAPKTGFIHYEDDVQVFAQPSKDVNRLMR